MVITLFRRAAICQSVAEVQLTDVAPLGAVSQRFNFFYYFLISISGGLLPHPQPEWTRYAVVTGTQGWHGVS